LGENVQPEFDPSAGRNRRWRIAILLVLAAMVALAAWAWWIPNGVFDRWIEAAKERLEGIRY
jgi:uncharacterized ion transporter superfamily protein YfcC